MTDDYAARMREAPQFKRLTATTRGPRVEPRWQPGSEGAEAIEAFCHDEVVRQFHDPRVPEDGGVRIRWMLGAWGYATRHRAERPDPNDIKILGANVEPVVNALGWRRERVWIGDREGRPFGDLDALMKVLCLRVQAEERLSLEPEADSAKLFKTLEVDFGRGVDRIRTADEWYLAFEWVHPFADGNGRTGKVLHNWLRGTLDRPELVADYFGGGNP